MRTRLLVPTLEKTKRGRKSKAKVCSKRRMPDSSSRLRNQNQQRWSLFGLPNRTTSEQLTHSLASRRARADLNWSGVRGEKGADFFTGERNERGAFGELKLKRPTGEKVIIGEHDSLDGVCSWLQGDSALCGAASSMSSRERDLETRGLRRSGEALSDGVRGRNLFRRGLRRTSCICSGSDGLGSSAQFSGMYESKPPSDSSPGASMSRKPLPLKPSWYGDNMDRRARLRGVSNSVSISSNRPVSHVWRSSTCAGPAGDRWLPCDAPLAAASRRAELALLAGALGGVVVGKAPSCGEGAVGTDKVDAGAAAAPTEDAIGVMARGIGEMAVVGVVAAG
eukprot:m.300796 g.300796  ORF g.300796 m.300796 type:complete len:337 (-) comp14540_c0_seq1:1054-2064(-)